MGLMRGSRLSFGKAGPDFLTPLEELLDKIFGTQTALRGAPGRIKGSAVVATVCGAGL